MQNLNTTICIGSIKLEVEQKEGIQNLNTTICIGSIMKGATMLDDIFGFKYNNLYRFNLA